nr:helix-turn-helix domain-containing protein [Haladaptatus pallidirubidus]
MDSAIEELSALPPSAKLVAKVLDDNHRLTQSQLEDKTLLPGRTVRSAVNQLKGRDLVESHPSPFDARKQCYSLAFDWK